MKPKTTLKKSGNHTWERAYCEYLDGHNGHGDPLSFEEFCGRLSPISGETFSKPEKAPAKPPLAAPPPGISDDPLDYDLNAEGAFGALVPANSKKKTPFANAHYQTRTDKPLAGRNQGKAEREGVYRPDNVGKIEEHRARGHTKVAGKHVRADGLVSRSGYRRVAPEALLRDNMERDSQIEDLKRLADSALRGRNRKIFTRIVIGPLEDLPRATYRELADQYGISITKVHRIIGDCLMRIEQAGEREKAGIPVQKPGRKRSSSSALARQPQPVDVKSVEQVPLGYRFAYHDTYRDVYRHPNDPGDEQPVYFVYRESSETIEGDLRKLKAEFDMAWNAYIKMR